MEVILALNGTLEKRAGFEHHPPKISVDQNGDGFAYEYEWSLRCEPTVVLRDAFAVDMNAATKIEGLRGNVQLEMYVSSYPDDHYFEDMRGAAYAMIHVRDADHVLQRVLDLIPRQQLTEMFVEIKYLESVLNFSGLKFNNQNGVAEPKDTKDWIRLSTHRVLEMQSDEIDQDTQFKATLTMQFQEHE